MEGNKVRRSEGQADYFKNTVQEEKVSRKSFQLFAVSSSFQSVFSCPLINKQKTEK